MLLVSVRNYILNLGQDLLLVIYLICLPGVGNLLNAVLDLILIYYFHIGIGGAAVATVISEYVDDVVKLLQWFLLLTSPKLYSSTISISLFLLKKTLLLFAPYKNSHVYMYTLHQVLDCFDLAIEVK